MKDDELVMIFYSETSINKSDLYFYIMQSIDFRITYFKRNWEILLLVFVRYSYKIKFYLYSIHNLPFPHTPNFHISPSHVTWYITQRFLNLNKSFSNVSVNHQTKKRIQTLYNRLRFSFCGPSWARTSDP